MHQGSLQAGPGLWGTTEYSRTEYKGWLFMWPCEISYVIVHT